MMGLHHFHCAWRVWSFEGCISWQGRLKRDCLASFYCSVGVYFNRYPGQSILSLFATAGVSNTRPKIFR